MIDILMATYNGETYLETQLESLINQTYPYWHLIIRDDGSTDHTRDIIERYAKKYPEKIDFYTNYVNSGSAKKNFMALLEDVRSEYVMFCDQDDIWDIDKVYKTYRAMKKLESREGKEIPLMIATDLRVMASDGRILDKSFLHYMNLPSKVLLRSLIIQNNITGCTAMINKNLCELLKKADHADKILMHDHFAAIVAALLGKIALMNHSTISYRQHEHNSVGAMDARSPLYMINRFKRGKKQFQQDMRNGMEQVGYILDLYDDQIKDPIIYEMLEEYSSLYEKNKLQRIIYFIKNKVYKHGVIRKLMQLVWC